MNAQQLPPALSRSRERGSAFVVVVVFGVLMAGILVSLQLATASQNAASLEGDLQARRLLVADNGLAKARSDALRNHLSYIQSPPGSGSATTVVNESFAQGGTCVATVHHIAGTGYPYTFRARSTATIAGRYRTLELIFQVNQPDPPAIGLPWLGAIVAAGDIEVLGNMNVDGNDHDPSGNDNPGGTHVPGTVTTGLVSQNGSATIGGGGDPPVDKSPGPDADAVTNNATTFSPEADPTNGTDDDGDGLLDENGFPKSAAEFFNINPTNPAAMTNAQFKARAQSQGTYFTSVASYDAWLASASSEEKGGKVIYLEFPNGDETLGQFNLPHNPPPADPSIVIVAHKEIVDDEAGPNPAPDRDGDGNTVKHEIEIGPVHVEQSDGTFQGLLMCDYVKNVNGNGKIVGAVVAFNGIQLDDTVSSSDAHFGNGGHEILFSSEVLATLPGVTTPTTPPFATTLLWREVR